MPQDNAGRTINDELVDAEGPLGVLVAEMKFQTIERHTK